MCLFLDYSFFFPPFFLPFFFLPSPRYLWSIGQTPFGPLSSSLELSFAQRDAVARHGVYALILAAMSAVDGVFDHFGAYSEMLTELLPPPALRHFLRRWATFQWKMRRSNHFLSHSE